MVQRKSFNLNLTRTARRLSGARRVAIALLLMLLTTATVWAEDNVSYRYYDSTDKAFKPGTANGVTAITDQTATWGTANTETWYVVNSDVTISDRITTAGNVHLILTDGYTLTAGKGITVNSGNSLTIYGQANGTGTLYAGATNGTDETADFHEAGIGGNTNGNGTITIDGGTVYAKGGTYSAGIGSGCNINSHNDCGTVIIHGGTVTATGGSYSAGIGGAGDRGNTSGTGGTIEITGGTVVANSGYSGAGIGGSGDGAGGTITISGGTVTANANGWGAGIGGGIRAAGGNIEITGGIIYASSSEGGSGVGKGRNGSDDGTNVTKTSGIIFEGNSGQAYGTSFTLTEDLTIPAGKTLTIPEGTTLIVPENVTLTNNGTIANNGTVDNDGTLTNAGALTNSGTIDNSGTATNTGTYSGNLITGNGTATNFIIDMTVTAENVNTTYDGQEHYITVNVSDPASGATITYCETETGTYTSTNPTYTDVCMKTVYYKVTASGYSDYYGSATVTINQKDLTVTANDHTISYGDAPANDGVTYSGFIEGEGQSVLSGTLTYAYKTNNDGTGNNYIASSPVGTYYIIPGGLTAANYAITFAAGTLTVGPKPTLTDAISYIDENGESKSKAAGSVYILAGTEQVLGVDGTETWYVCNTDLTYADDLTLLGDVNLIIAAGSTMNVNSIIGSNGTATFDLTIYGQAPANGDYQPGNCILASSERLTNFDSFTVNGGRVTADMNIDASNITINGGQVTSGDKFYASNIITLGWNNANDYIATTNGYEGTVKIAEGQRFVAYNASTGTAASAIVSGSTNDSKPTFTLDAIAGKTLKPFEGYVVSIEDENISIMDGESVKTADFTITTGEGNEAVTIHYYIYEASTEANPVTVTLSYSGDLVTLGGLPEGTTLSAVEGQAMQRSFTMPATDVALTATDVTSLTATTVTYDGNARTPVIKQGDDVFAAANYTIAYKLGNAEVTAADVKDANTYTCTLTGLGQYVGTASVDFTINKANYYQSDDNLDITKYVPSDKAGSFTITLPELPTGATYSCYIGQEDDVHMLISTFPTISSGKLIFTTNSGKAAGTRATITVEAKDAPNYNDYSFKVNVVVSEYTVAYAWPEQTSIWLDADNELVWSAAGVTLDRSKLTVKKGSATVTDYTAKVGDTELTDGENTLALEPGAYRIAITGDNGKLDDWVNFKVIQLTEDDDVFSVNVDDCTWPLVGGSGGNAADTPPKNTAKLLCNGEELTYSTDMNLNEFLSAHPGLKLWFEDNDHTPGNAYVSRIFTLNGLSEGDFYNMPEPVLEYRGLDYLGNLGSIVAAGSDDQRVFLPHGMSFKQLKDDDDQPVPASSAGGTIYYLCVDPPALHYVETEGANGMEWALYNGNTPVPENHYFRDSENNVYYGNGSAYTHYNASSTNGNFISFTPISYVVHGGPGNWNMDNIKVDPDNEYKFSYYCYFKWQNCDLDGDYFELVGKDFVILDGGVFFYTGDIVPEVVDGNKIRIGDSFIRSVDKDSNPDHTPIVWLRNATIADLIGEERNCPSAYAKYKVDDYHYQVASDSFLIYPNNSLVDIAELASVSKVGEDVTCKVVLHGPKTAVANVFLNGEWYRRLEETRSHELTITGLHEGTYAIDVFLDGDDYVTPYHTNASFTVVKNDPVLTITGTTPAGAAFVNGGEIEYDPEKPVIITVANDAAVSGTSWKWTISDTDVVTQDHIVNESGENAVNRESIYLNTVGLGEVTVTARFSGNELYNPARKSITFTVAPLMTTLFAANTTNQWMTWCNAYAWTLPEGCNAYTINSVSGTTVTLNEVTAEGNASVIIPAYTPVLIQRETIGDDAVMAEFSAVGTAPETGYNSETGLVTSTGTGFTFYGNSGNDAITTGYYTAGQTYGLYNNVFVRIDSDSDNGLAAHRCVLTVSGSNARQLSIGTEATGITTTDYTDFTDSDGAWYSLDGRKLNGKPTKKGLYIHNGVKTIIK